MNDERSPLEASATAGLTDTQILSRRQMQQSTATEDNYQPLWFWRLHSSWSSFVRGLFWGGIIASTAIVSASLGVGLTRIAVVEKVIAQTIDYKTYQARSDTQVQRSNQPSLTRPVNILLIEVPNDPNDLLAFDRDFVGRTKTILLLKFNPQLGTVEAINIPTNSRVKIPGLGWGTIADAHSQGGTALVSQMISQLLPDVVIDGYMRATTQTWRQLSASGKLTLVDCNGRIENCQDRKEQVLRQENTFKSIRQHLSVPAYLNNIKITASELQSQLDSNISASEIMLIINFIQELESDKITVSLLPGYIPGKTMVKNNRGNFNPQSLSHNYQ
ncbi:cell envelope-related transcriptional attenuator [Chondrocystis sp. NIES-4102]|nr:cell envelope-related transcriptional attenuator [Chondrocystis sp. NIES-4102]